MLKGLDPLENKAEWKELLESLGLSDTAAIEEVREYLIEAFQTGAAKEIREGIKYLNQRRLKPDQERLGVTYIERDEDYKEVDPDNRDALYEQFKAAGFNGTIDDFYDDFMPDMDRGEMDFINKALENDLKFEELSDDPFETLSFIGSLTGEKDTNIFGDEMKDEKKEDSSSYFDLFDDDDAYSGSQGSEDFTKYMALFN